MPGNDFLINARRGRNDEFYTQYSDIESEMSKFEKFFQFCKSLITELKSRKNNFIMVINSLSQPKGSSNN